MFVKHKKNYHKKCKVQISLFIKRKKVLKFCQIVSTVVCEMKSLILKVAVICAILYEIESFSCGRNTQSDMSCYLHGGDCDCQEEVAHNARVERPKSKKVKQKNNNQSYRIEVPQLQSDDDDSYDDKNDEAKSFSAKVVRPVDNEKR